MLIFFIITTTGRQSLYKLVDSLLDPQYTTLETLIRTREEGSRDAVALLGIYTAYLISVHEQNYRKSFNLLYRVETMYQDSENYWDSRRGSSSSSNSSNSNNSSSRQAASVASRKKLHRDINNSYVDDNYNQHSRSNNKRSSLSRSNNSDDNYNDDGYDDNYNDDDDSDDGNSNVVVKSDETKWRNKNSHRYSEQYKDQLY